jgi:hypothetical protein
MARIGFHKRSVWTLGAVIPSVGRLPPEALHECLAVLAGLACELTGFEFAEVFEIATAQVLPARGRIGLKVGTDAGEGEDPPAVLPIVRIGHAAIGFVWEDHEVIAVAVAPRLGTGRTPGGGLAGGVMPDFFKQGEIERHNGRK